MYFLYLLGYFYNILLNGRLKQSLHKKGFSHGPYRKLLLTSTNISLPSDLLHSPLFVSKIYSFFWLSSFCFLHWQKYHNQNLWKFGMIFRVVAFLAVAIWAYPSSLKCGIPVKSASITRLELISTWKHYQSSRLKSEMLSLFAKLGQLHFVSSRTSLKRIYANPIGQNLFRPLYNYFCLISP